MITLIFSVVLAIAGLVLITKGSGWATDSLVPVAKRLNTTYIAIGLILVSIMVSLPEIIVAIYTALKGHMNISLGVIIGSVICNIGLMTGLSAMIRPLKVSKHLILRDGIFAVCIAIMVLVLSIDHNITRAEGAAFILMFVPYVINVFIEEKSERLPEKEKELVEMELELQITGLKFGKIRAGLLSFLIGISVLLIGSYFFSEALIKIAKLSGLSDLLIGLTIGAIGPSIPNIAAAIQGTMKKIGGIAISETLGSNIFTLLVTLGVLSMIRPINISTSWLRFDIPIMVLMSLIMLFFMIYKQEVTREEGAILFISYIVILIVNVFAHL
jgi:cation:H+ antiporter